MLLFFITFSLKLYVVVLYFFCRNISIILRYDFHYNFINVFWVVDIFCYPILIHNSINEKAQI